MSGGFLYGILQSSRNVFLVFDGTAQNGSAIEQTEKSHASSTDKRVREVEDEAERQRLWDASAEAYPPYNEYQAKTTRRIPVFLAEPA